MKTRLPWRAHNPTGWAEMVGRLKLGPIEEWAVLRLLDRQWVTGHLPTSPAQVQAFLQGLGLKPLEAKRLKLQPLLDNLFPINGADPSTRLNPELAEERARALDWTTNAQVRGKRAALLRWHGKEATE